MTLVVDLCARPRVSNASGWNWMPWCEQIFAYFWRWAFGKQVEVGVPESSTLLGAFHNLDELADERLA